MIENNTRKIDPLKVIAVIFFAILIFAVGYKMSEEQKDYEDKLEYFCINISGYEGVKNQDDVQVPKYCYGDFNTSTGQYESKYYLTKEKIEEITNTTKGK